MWLLGQSTPPDPLPGIGTYALVSALCTAIIGLWFWLRATINGRIEDRNAREMEAKEREAREAREREAREARDREMAERMVRQLTETTVLMERIVRYLDDLRAVPRS